MAVDLLGLANVGPRLAFTLTLKHRLLLSLRHQRTLVLEHCDELVDLVARALYEAPCHALTHLIQPVGQVVAHVLLLLRLQLGDRLLEELKHRVVLSLGALQGQQLPQVLPCLVQIQLLLPLFFLQRVLLLSG